LKKQKRNTTEPVTPGNFTGARPEFGRASDVARIFGIKRGTLYALLGAGRVKGVLLRVQGKQSGVRLFEMASIEELIRSEMAAAYGGGAA
jgi:hypothetical protein